MNDAVVAAECDGLMAGVAAVVCRYPGEYPQGGGGPVGVAGVAAGWSDYLALFTKHIVFKAF